jgi:hemoglobin
MAQTDTGVEAEEKKASPYDMIGGGDVVRQIVNRFYDIMDTAPDAAGIRAMHGRDLSPMRERLFEFLSGWLGGPPLYFQQPNHKCIMSAHRPYTIGAPERDQWMLCIRRAMADCGVSQEVRTLLDPAFLRMCEAFSSRGK